MIDVPQQSGQGFIGNTNFGNCDSMSGNGCETDLRVSNTNCGACGNACPSGQLSAHINIDTRPFTGSVSI